MEMNSGGNFLFLQEVKSKSQEWGVGGGVGAELLDEEHR